MREAYSLVWSVLVLLFRSRLSLEAEILILRHQLNIQRRHVPKRVAFSAMDRRSLFIVPVSDGIGAGNPATAAADQLYRWKFAG